MNNKVISVHNHACKSKCAHAKECYFVNGKHFDTNERDVFEIPRKIEEVIEKISFDKQVHYSGCDFTESFYTYGTNIRGNEDYKHMTISYNHYHKMTEMLGIENKKAFDKNIQMTVYDKTKLLDRSFRHIQKMFLIKDEASYKVAVDIFKHSGAYNKIHFPIEQTWAEENTDKILILVSLWNMQENNTLSLDSCLENYVTNGTCVYANEYIDLRYDGSVRRCPFSDEYHKINYDNPDAMFDIEFRPHCIFGKMFGREEWRSGNTQK